MIKGTVYIDPNTFPGTHDDLGAFVAFVREEILNGYKGASDITVILGEGRSTIEAASDIEREQFFDLFGRCLNKYLYRN